jgi:hypothetical protein
VFGVSGYCLIKAIRILLLYNDITGLIVC